jgi:hypothetical protein
MRIRVLDTTIILSNNSILLLRLDEAAGCHLRRWDEPWRAYYKQLMRKRIETVFSQITAMFPRHIHAVSLRGFLLKVSFFVIAFALDKAFI